MKNFLLGFVILLFSAVIYSAYVLGWSDFFIFPVLIITEYIAYYLHIQFEKDGKNRLEKAVKIEQEDKEAEAWIEETLVPRTINYSISKRRTIVVYVFMFITGIYFLWRYVETGLYNAVLDTILAGAIFCLLILYMYSVPLFIKRFIKFWPVKFRSAFGNEWVLAYIFLWPMGFVIYLIYPVEVVDEQFYKKILSIPSFFLTYTFSFLSLYSIYYFYNESRKDEDKKIEKNIESLT